jgi:hypothetical protein
MSPPRFSLGLFDHFTPPKQMSKLQTLRLGGEPWEQVTQFCNIRTFEEAGWVAHCECEYSNPTKLVWRPTCSGDVYSKYENYSYLCRLLGTCFICQGRHRRCRTREKRGGGASRAALPSLLPQASRGCCRAQLSYTGGCPIGGRWGPHRR